MTEPRILVIDVGSSSVRAIAFDPDGTMAADHRRPIESSASASGAVELDADALARDALDLAVSVIDEVGSVAAVGVSNQRATTVAWDPETGSATAPALSWQDLRTVGRCLELQSEGIRFAPNAMPTKAAHLLAAAPPGSIVGTVDTWIAWHLTGGAVHVTDASNASVSGLTDDDVTRWRTDLCDRLGLPTAALPSIVASAGVVGETVLPGHPPLTSLVGDQQASLRGQGGETTGATKITFGTGAMADSTTGDRPPPPRHGTVPMIAWRTDAGDTWCSEAIALAAGSCVSWLVDLGVLSSEAEAGPRAASVSGTDGVVFVPALQGLATPTWDHGARGTLLGLSRGSTAAHVTRAVLDGVAMQAADLIEALAADTGRRPDAVRVDGGMTVNDTFLSLLADAVGAAVEVSPHREATAWGAALLAAEGAGIWADSGAGWSPARRVEPTDAADSVDRERWAAAMERSRQWIPSLSGLSF